MMSKKNLFLFCAATLVGGFVFAGCGDLEPDSCNSDADCDGFVCNFAGVEAGEPGTCFSSCTTAAQCQTGFTCGSDGTCVTGTGPDPDPDDSCTTDAQCAATGYLCNTDAGACYETCTDGSECADGRVCTANACETVTAEPYLYVAVTSETAASTDEVRRTPNPGPDIDAIEVIVGGVTRPASAIAKMNQGAAGNDPNSAPNSDASLGAPSTRNADGTCDLNAQNYWAMGDNTGYAVWSFGAGFEIEDNAQVRVHEVDRTMCSNVTTNWADAFNVYIGTAANLATANSAADVRSMFCGIGNHPTGGIQTFTVNLGACN
jgi:hypothetical protein